MSTESPAVEDLRTLAEYIRGKAGIGFVNPQWADRVDAAATALEAYDRSKVALESVERYDVKFSDGLFSVVRWDEVRAIIDPPMVADTAPLPGIINT